MKKCLTLVLSVVFMLSLCIPVAAVSDSEMEVESFSISEYEMVLRSHQEWLEEKSRNVAENAEMQSDPLEDYKDFLNERAALPEEVLRGYGYSDEQIDILKQYNRGELSFDEAARSSSAYLNGSLYCGTHTTTKYSVTYSWEWDILPDGLGQDGFGLGVYGIDSQSAGFDTRLESSAASVTYYYMTGTRYRSENVSKTPNTNNISAKFDSYKIADSGDRWVWAKSGTVTIVIVPTVSGGKQFAAVRARGEYSHSSNDDIQLSLGISVNVLTGSIGFSASISNGSSGSINQCGVAQAVFYNNGSIHEEV